MTKANGIYGHYSFEKTSMALGLGNDNVIKVPCDGQGKNAKWIRWLFKKTFLRRLYELTSIIFFIDRAINHTVIWGKRNAILY